jgi:hypothetical protein
MCFHIGPEFVEALWSQPAARSPLDTQLKVSDDTHPRRWKKHLTSVGHICTRLRSVILTAVPIKTILLILWACL